MCSYVVCVAFRYFIYQQKTAYEIGLSLVGSEMCIRVMLGPGDFRGLQMF